MAQLTPSQARRYASQAGFVGNDLDVAVAVIWAESSGRTDATNAIGNSAGIDRGLWQINSYYHAEVTDQCAYDPACSSQAAYRIYREAGSRFQPWSAYNNGRYRQFLGISTGSNTPGSTGENVLASFYQPSNITQRYGVLHMGTPGAGPHNGVDYGWPAGKEIPSLTSGVVERVNTRCPQTPGTVDSCGGGFGNYVYVRMPDRRLAVYAHLLDVHVKVGDTVAMGQIVGTTGDSGFSTGPHLHFELQDATGRPTDPTALINQAVQVGAPSSGTPRSRIGLPKFNQETYIRASYGLNRTFSRVEGIDGIAAAIYSSEQFRPFAALNPIGSVVTNFRAIMVRGLVIITGLVLLVMAGISLLNTPAGQAATGTFKAGARAGATVGGAAIGAASGGPGGAVAGAGVGRALAK